ncbi:MAG TPA: GTPase [Candidatus Nanoarchaeia archaeon]|nr:GTPase [Candidatus Nanoarchaeia archaeon]
MRVRYLFSSRRTRRIEGKNQHRVAYPTLARNVIRISDIVLEVLDARYLAETRNLVLEREIKDAGKLLFYIINKADLVDLKELKQNVEELGLTPYVLFSCTTMIGRKQLRERIRIEIKRQKLKQTKGFQRAHVGVIGYPNVGKSSLLNLLTHRSAARTSAQAGFTRGLQKIRFTKDIMIIDSPGVISEGQNIINREDKRVQTKIGVRNYDSVKDPEFVVSALMGERKGLFEQYYGVAAEGDAEILLEELGKRWNFVKKKGVVDIERAARKVLKDWQESIIKKR